MFFLKKGLLQLYSFHSTGYPIEKPLKRLSLLYFGEKHLIEKQILITNSYCFT